jgi:hypothetical protein
MRRTARVLLTVLLLASLALSGWQGWRLASGWPGAVFVDRAAAEVVGRLDRALARRATAARLVARLETLLDDQPRNWLAIEALEGVAEERGIALPADLLARRAALHAQDTGWTVTGGKCLACMWDPRACDFSAVMLCRAPLDLTPLGDVAGVVREGSNYALGRDVDEVELILSVVGLTAVALVPVTAGGSAPIKVGAGLGKSAWRMGRLSPGLTAVFNRAARDGVDWARIGAVRGADDLAALTRPAALGPALSVAQDAGRMRSALGTRPALHMLSRADTPAEARRMANAAEALGPRSVGALEALGKSRFLRATRRWSREVWWAISGVIGAFAALAGLFWSVATSAALRRLRRLARPRP